jgi:hypothetical protein
VWAVQAQALHACGNGSQRGRQQQGGSMQRLQPGSELNALPHYRVSVVEERANLIVVMALTCSRGIAAATVTTAATAAAAAGPPPAVPHHSQSAHTLSVTPAGAFQAWASRQEATLQAATVAAAER